MEERASIMERPERRIGMSEIFAGESEETE
jgi:hypothetical protein